MEKAKTYAYRILLLLCVASPLALFVFLWGVPAIPQDLSRYEYFAVTAPTGEERIFRAGEKEFDDAALAFTQADAVSSLPTELEDAVFLSTEWIRNNRAQAWRLYLLPAKAEGYLVDERNHVFCLREESVLFLLQSGFVSPLLVGENPPALMLDGREHAFALCSWTYTVTPTSGAPVTVFSGEYANTEGESFFIDAASFTPRFAETPKNIVYKVYSGADEVLSTADLPQFDTLPSGAYQLIVVAEWQKENVFIRAGYSFSFEQ